MPHFQGTESKIWFEQEGPEGAPQLVWVGGGGARGRDWQRFQTPHFRQRYRTLVFDNRGIGDTTCNAPMPWPIESFARDLAELSEAQCNGPAIYIGSSLGSAILASSSARPPRPGEMRDRDGHPVGVGRHASAAA